MTLMKIPSYRLGMHALWSLTCLVILVFSGVLRIAPAAAQEPTGTSVPIPSNWSTPVELGPGWFPDITSDASGRVHIAWSSSYEDRIANQNKTFDQPKDGYDQVMYTYTDNGVEIPPANDIIALPWSGGSEVTRPALLVGQNGLLHISFRGVIIYYDRVLVEQALDAQAWKSPYPMSSGQVGYFSRLAIDASGKLHIIYTENVRSPACAICYHIYYRNSTDNGYSWSLRTDISNLPTGSAKPQILIDSAQNIHVVWEAGEGGAYGQLTDPTTVMYTSSYDGGETWSSPHEFAVPNGQAKDIAIGVDNLDHIVVTYLALPDDKVMYSISADNGRTWSEPVAIDGIFGSWRNYQSRLDDYSIARDSYGNLHLLLVGRVGELDPTLSILHLTWDGQAWSQPDVVTTISGDVPEWPRVTVNGGNQLHLVWFVRDQAHIFNSDNGIYKVYYANRLIEAPSGEFIDFPTPTVPPVPTPTPVYLTPTPTAVDPNIRLTPVVPGLGDSIYTEADEMKQMGSALVPALIFIALALGLLLVIRRR